MQFVEDLKTTLEDMKNDPKLNHTDDRAIYGMASAIPDKKFMNEIMTIVVSEMLDTHQ